MEQTYQINNPRENEIISNITGTMRNSLTKDNNTLNYINNFRRSSYNKPNNFNPTQSFNDLNIYNRNPISSQNFNPANSLYNNESNNFNSRITYYIESEDSDEEPKRTKKRTKSTTTIKKNENNNIDYEEEIEKKRLELEKYKTMLVKERIKENNLKKQVDIKKKKEGQLRELDGKIGELKDKKNEILYKIDRSERLRGEQKCVLDGLIAEYNELLRILNTTPDLEISHKINDLVKEEVKYYQGNQKEE